jgi:peptidyl-prolyl cis-trans isomerase SurA
MNKFFAFLISFGCFLTAINAQTEDPVLFTVGGRSVNLSEFKYIYQKTNGDKADFSRQSLEEYLDLYTKFKRKVSRARDMQLDTIVALQTELAGYRQQLANSYLVDKEVSERLVEETYNRMKKDVEISHILFKIDRSAIGKDTVDIYKKAMAAKARLDKGEDFVKVAREVSEDPSVKENEGKLGFITAMLPNGFDEIEGAAYNTKIGGISKPVRTDMGYHIVRVENTRDARGEIEAAHILIRSNPERVIRARLKIDSVYQELKSGASSFDELAIKYSEDRASASRGGQIGFFGINRYELAFENAAFNLTKDGEYSAPFESSVGWHIIKRISKKNIKPFEQEKRVLKAKVQKDSRYEAANMAFVNRIKTNGGLKEEAAVLDKFIAVQTDTFMTYRWHAPETPSNELLLSFNNGKKFTLGDFTEFINNNSRKRLGFAQGTSANDAVRSLYTDFVKEACLKFEESQLDTKYPEFKSLMREYEEGILLFEAMKREVWEKASQDSVGLYAFHKTQTDKYKWDERAEGSVYTLKKEAKDQIESVRALAAKKNYSKVLKKINAKSELLMVQPFKAERGKNKSLDAIGKWSPKALSITETEKASGDLMFYKIDKVTPPTVKTLSESRGYVVADYQEYLEKKWMADLEKSYEIKVNKMALEGLIKK